MAIPILNEKQLLQNLHAQTNPFFKDYYAFYSSWLGGITTIPCMMLIPLDDHMVHRGDGVFEAVKAVARGVYLLDEHLERLFESAKKIGIVPPYSKQEMTDIILETLHVADQQDAMLRIFLSRGPGNFSVNPYDSIGAQFHVLVSRLRKPPTEKYQTGTTIGQSHIPTKDAWMAQIKSCNYLPNVLMKKEAVDRQLDFVIGIDDKGHITESATENIMIVDANNTIIYPKLDYILKGTTMIRACELAQAHGITVETKPISLADIKSAREVMMTGTTLNVLPVVAFEGESIGGGKPGPITIQLHDLVQNDMLSGPRRTLY